MTTNATPTTASSLSLASAGRSLLSRITSPLKARTRNLTDFFIQPQDPHRQYSPGDLVKGAVILTVNKPIRITHLTVCLHGFVRVFKSANGANEPPLPVDAVLTAASNPRKSQYFGNGHASLFQDEVTLCGEGRLEAGVYEFNFELEFPTKGLPTSIDFERGTISYMITSTITRPTSIAATSSCDKKISLVETVDIGPMNPPKPRTISLEPISRRTRRKKPVKTKTGSTADGTDVSSPIEPSRAPGSPLPDDSASQRGSVDHNANPRSPIPSDMQSTISATTSTDSTTSGSTSFRLGPVPSTARSARDSQQGSKISQTVSDKTITATIELLKSGCLPGDNLPLKISIKHTKAIKSMHGIIITLYRQGRIDSAPPLSLFADIKGKAAERLKHEEYYPKSKTGLGGLSLTSAGSSSLFRKDLAQTFAPLLVDPTTLTTTVTASVRVPEDVFPTITGVPGQMISFKYYIEVVVDLGGKLAGQQRHLPRIGAVSSIPSSFGNSSNGNPNMLAAWGGSIVETDQIRREKSVVACLFEVVVGSTDSARRRGRGSSTAKTPVNGWPEEAPNTLLSPHEPIYEEPSRSNGEDHNADGHYHRYDQSREGFNENDPYAYDDYDWYPEDYPPPSHAQITIPPPDMHGEEGLSDKERARRAEARLLPSQPPTESQSPSSSRTIVPPTGPSAPPDEHDEDDLYSADDATPHARPVPMRSLSQAGASSQAFSGPSVPALKDLGPAASSNPSEDKQELERQRMLAEASAPSIRDEDDNAGEGSSSGAYHEPSAPALCDEEEYGGRYAHASMAGPSTSHESLPRYER